MGSVHALAARVKARTSPGSAPVTHSGKGGQDLSGDELGQLSSILQRVKLVQMVFKAHTQAEKEVVRGARMPSLPRLASRPAGPATSLRAAIARCVLLPHRCARRSGPYRPWRRGKSPTGSQATRWVSFPPLPGSAPRPGPLVTRVYAHANARDAPPPRTALTRRQAWPQLASSCCSCATPSSSSSTSPPSATPSPGPQTACWPACAATCGGTRAPWYPL